MGSSHTLNQLDIAFDDTHAVAAIDEDAWVQIVHPDGGLAQDSVADLSSSSG